MAGGKVETDLKILAHHCDMLMIGTKRMFDLDGGPNHGDMWFFELYHHLSDCAAALRKAALTEV